MMVPHKTYVSIAVLSTLILYFVAFFALRHMIRNQIVLLFLGQHAFYCIICGSVLYMHTCFFSESCSAAASALTAVGVSIFISAICFGAFLFRVRQTEFSDIVELGIHDAILGAISTQQILFAGSTLLVLRGRRKLDQIIACIVSIVTIIWFLPGILWLRW